MEKKITINPQEYCGEDWEFYGVDTYCTPAFISAFGSEHMRVAFVAHMLIQETYPDGHWDYLQTFHCDGIDFWIISDCPKGKTGHITILLPSDY